MKAYLSKQERNSRVCTSLFPLWAIPFTFYMFYLSLYLKEAGFSDVQIGNIMVVSNIAALASSFVASPLVDRLGRKRATLLFDLLSSVLPALLFLLWPRYEIALIAMAFTGMNRIMSVGYYLLMIEDTSEENCVVSMNLFNLILVTAGLLTPLAGMLVLRWGVVRTEEILLLFAVISMTSQALIRHFLLKETPTGVVVRDRMRAKGRFWTFSRFFEAYRTVYTDIKKEPAVLRAMGINALIYVYFSLGTTASLLFTPFFIDFVHISPSEVSLIGGVYSLGTLLAMLCINPRLERKNYYTYAIYSSLVSLVGFALLLFGPKGDLILPLVAVSCIAPSYGVLKTLADVVLAVETHGEHRAAVFASSYLISSFLGIILIKITSLLYAQNPGWLLGVCGFLLGGVLVLSMPKGGLNHGKL